MWTMGSLTGGTIVFGPGFLTGPIRIPTYLRMRHKGYTKHKFRPHIRKDMHGPEVMNFCDLCNAYKGNWIHLRNDEGEIEIYDPNEDAIVLENKIKSLESQDIKWRFDHDPEWVEVFGSEYDRATGERIPQFHNGTCGGPHDDCDRCNWEYDQQERKAVNQKYFEKRVKNEKEDTLFQEELEGYIDILWTIWNTCHDPEDAFDEFEDITDELGMLKNARLRDKVKDSEPYKRLVHCVSDTDHKRWKRREEYWYRKVKSQKQRYSDYVDHF